MGAGGLFSGLIGGYSDTMLKRHKDEQDRKERGTQLQIENLRLAAEAQIKAGNMEGAGEALKQVDELLQDYTGAKSKKGGFSLGNLVGHFQDTGGARQKSSGQGGTAGTQPQQVGASATPPVTPQAGGPPTRADAFKFPTHEKMIEQQIHDTVAVANGEINGLAQATYGKDLKELEPWEKADVLDTFYKNPRAKMHPVIYDDAQGVHRLGMQAENGIIFGGDGKQVADAKAYVKAPHQNLKQIAYIADDGRLSQGYADETDPANPIYYGGKGVLLTDTEIPRIQPAAAYLPSTVSGTTLQPSQVADPTAPGGIRIGPAITSQTQSTHQKVPISSPPTRPKSPSEPPTRENMGGKSQTAPSGAKKGSGGLPYAPPKALAAQYQEKSSTYKHGMDEANKEYATAQKELEALQKEARNRGLVDFKGDVPIQQAEQKLKVLKVKAARARAASELVEHMRQSVSTGIVSMDIVEQQAQDIINKGIRPTGQ